MKDDADRDDDRSRSPPFTSSSSFSSPSLSPGRESHGSLKLPAGPSVFTPPSASSLPHHRTTSSSSSTRGILSSSSLLTPPAFPSSSGPSLSFSLNPLMARVLAPIQSESSTLLSLHGDLSMKISSFLKEREATRHQRQELLVQQIKALSDKLHGGP